MEDLKWRKSSRSGDNGGGCVEVATNRPGAVFIRDSKDPHSPILRCSPTEWQHFLDSLRG